MCSCLYSCLYTRLLIQIHFLTLKPVHTCDQNYLCMVHKWFPYSLRIVCVPNACTCGWYREHALCHLHTVCVPFVTNQNLPIFCANTKGILRSPCRQVFSCSQVARLLLVFFAIFFSIWTNQCLLCARWNYGSLCVHLMFIENWFTMCLVRIIHQTRSTIKACTCVLGFTPTKHIHLFSHSCLYLHTYSYFS